MNYVVRSVKLTWLPEFSLNPEMRNKTANKSDKSVPTECKVLWGQRVRDSGDKHYLGLRTKFTALSKTENHSHKPPFLAASPCLTAKPAAPAWKKMRMDAFHQLLR